LQRRVRPAWNKIDAALGKVITNLQIKLGTGAESQSHSNSSSRQQQ
jgi:hypothetical protein